MPFVLVHIILFQVWISKSHSQAIPKKKRESKCLRRCHMKWNCLHIWCHYCTVWWFVALYTEAPRGSLINFSFAHLSYRCIAWPLHSSRRHSVALCDSFSLKSWHQISPRYYYPDIKWCHMTQKHQTITQSPHSLGVLGTCVQTVRTRHP